MALCEDGVKERDGGAFARWGGLRCIGLLLMLVYAAGLTHDLTRPWTGYHDFLGAFYSQFARNTLRYPGAIHHGIPMMAMGESLPPPDQQSLYATHPPGLVWMLCGLFTLFGQAEWVARLLPILCSLGAILLLISEVARSRDRATAVLAGLIYAVLPLAVFFGRLVDHEAVCLLGMLAVVRCMGWMHDSSRERRIDPAAAICLLLALLIWIDWAGLLFAALFAAYAAYGAARRGLPKTFPVAVVLVVLIATVAMAAYLVHYGLDGRWSVFVALAQGRTGADAGAVRHLAWGHTLRAFSWPVLVLSVLAFAVCLQEMLVRRGQPSTSDTPRRDDRHTPSAMFVLHLTGIVWLLVFWRQYEIHNYWIFYLGPLAAIATARAILWLRVAMSRVICTRKAEIACAVLVLVVVACCLRRTDAYFRWVRYEEQDKVRAWQAIHASTQPNVLVLLPEDPRDESPHGDYVFRNIMPPQLAYYLDRSWEVVRSVEQVMSHAGDDAIFIIEARDAGALPDAMAALQERFPSARVGPFMVFNLQSAGSVEVGGG